MSQTQIVGVYTIIPAIPHPSQAPSRLAYASPQRCALLNPDAQPDLTPSVAPFPPPLCTTTLQHPFDNDAQRQARSEM